MRSLSFIIKKENEGKPAGTLKSKTHKNLKERFINCFDENSKEVYLDKTVIGFSLYKLNKDEEVKKKILEKSNWSMTIDNFNNGAKITISKNMM